MLSLLYSVISKFAIIYNVAFPQCINSQIQFENKLITVEKIKVANTENRGYLEIKFSTFLISGLSIFESSS